MLYQLKGRAEVVEIKDAMGRVLTLNEPNFLQESRLTRTCGASDEVVSGSVIPSLWVTAIDGAPVPWPETVEQLQKLVDHVGPDACSLILQSIHELHTAWEIAGRELAKDPAFRSAVGLLKSKVPFELIFTNVTPLSAAEKQAFAIVLQELERGE